MSRITLTVPTITANGKKVYIIPGSFNFEAGRGTTDVSSVSGGGDDSESVHAPNAENQNGKCNFKVNLDIEDLRLVENWKANIGGNVFEATQEVENGKTINLVFPGASMMNDIKGDKEIEVNSVGDPMIAQ